MASFPLHAFAGGKILVCLLSGCGSASNTIPLLHAAGAPLTLTPIKAIPLEVVTHSTGVPDPMPVSGSATWSHAPAFLFPPASAMYGGGGMATPYHSSSFQLSPPDLTAPKNSGTPAKALSPSKS
ncbi:MAG: hypothetical protein ABI461_13150 [Polyangiaceae bacterium]